MSKGGFVVLVHPMKDDPEEGPVFHAAVAQSTKSEPQSGKDMIPKGWGGVYQRRYIPLAEVPYFNKPHIDGATHLALLTGPAKQGDPFYFAGEPIDAHSLLVWFNETTQKYVFLHCHNCASVAVMFLHEKQEAWRANSRSYKAAGSTH